MSEREYICRCEEITKEEILTAIKEGRTSIKSIKKATRAGMGACQGRTCSKLIMRMLTNEGIANNGDIELDKSRFPLVPVPISSLDFGGEENA